MSASSSGGSFRPETLSRVSTTTVLSMSFSFGGVGMKRSDGSGEDGGLGEVVVRAVLEGRPQVEQGLLVVGAPDELQAHGQSLDRSHGHAEARLAREVERQAGP